MEDKDNTDIVREVLSETNAQLRRIAPLNKIIVRSYSGLSDPSVIEFLQGLGWIVLIGDR